MYKKKIIRLLSLALCVSALLLFSCITYEEELRIDTDGSGHIGLLISFPKSGGKVYSGNIPLSRQEMEERLPEGLKLDHFQIEEEKAYMTYRLGIDFEDIDTLLGLKKVMSGDGKGIGFFKDQVMKVTRERFDYVYERTIKKRGKGGIIDQGDGSKTSEIRKKLLEQAMDKIFKRFKWKFTLTVPTRILETNGKLLGEYVATWEVPLSTLIRSDYTMRATIQGPYYHRIVFFGGIGLGAVIVIFIGFLTAWRKRKGINKAKDEITPQRRNNSEA